MATKLTVYNSLILPHFSYCCSILYVTCTNFDRLQKLQNKAMRIILKCDRYTSIQNMLNLLNWLDVENYYFVQAMTFVYKMINEALPEYLKDQLISVSEIHSYRTRSASNFYVPPALKYCTMNSLFHKGISQYNHLPQNLKDLKSVHSFKTHMRKFASHT